MFNLFFIYFDFLHHLLSEIKEKKLYVFLQHFVYQHYIEVKDAANWMLCVHWKVCLNIAHNDWTINFAVPFPQYWHSKCNRFTAVAFFQFTCQLFNVSIISSLQYFFANLHAKSSLKGWSKEFGYMNIFKGFNSRCMSFFESWSKSL